MVFGPAIAGVILLAGIILIRNGQRAALRKEYERRGIKQAIEAAATKEECAAEERFQRLRMMM